jgi:CBS domain-containing protein
MVPLSEYVTVSSDATLFDAVMALREAQEKKATERKYLHRAILALDENGATVGKVSMLDILRSLEPKYDEMLSDRGSLHLGFTASFQKMMIEQLKLWNEPLEHICEKAAKLKVRSFMATPREGEIISSNATLDEAIHLLLLGSHQSLLVTEDNTVIGILRLTDVFEAVTDAIFACEL